MKAIWVVISGLVLVMALPFMLRDEVEVMPDADATVIIVTPHNESIRQEFARGFREWFKARTGRTVYVDYRNVGGTSEITRYLGSEYLNAFRNHWTGELGREWGAEVQRSFANRRMELDTTPEDDTLGEAARRAFLASDVSCGLDVFFGGGSYDFIRQAQMGTLVPSGLLESHHEWFGDEPMQVPQRFAGEPFFDAEGRWFGAVLSSFGIIFNRVSLRRLGIEEDPTGWEDLADPRLLGEVAVSDPTKSGSMNKAFEMIIQDQMQQRLRQLQTAGDGRALQELEYQAVREGWEKAMRLIQRVAANARYFTDSSQKPNIDISMGDCAIGMSIDFYGRFQEEAINRRGGERRFGYVTPKGASTVSVDPIGLLRGAPNRETAVLFIEYVMSVEGQKLWNFPVGVEGGPHRFALRRPPVRKEFYESPLNEMRSDASVNPYDEAGEFVYRGDWTARLFTAQRFLIRVAFMDTQEELASAWEALIESGYPVEAMRLFDDVSSISYDIVKDEIAPLLSDGSKIEEVRLARELAGKFRERFKEVERLAEAARQL